VRTDVQATMQVQLHVHEDGHAHRRRSRWRIHRATARPRTDEDEGSMPEDPPRATRSNGDRERVDPPRPAGRCLSCSVDSSAGRGPEKGSRVPRWRWGKRFPFSTSAKVDDQTAVNHALGTHVCTSVWFNHEVGPAHASRAAFAEVSHSRTRRGAGTGTHGVVHFEFHGHCRF